MNRYVIFAIIATVIVLGSYIVHFYINLGYVLSGDTAVWAALGDYTGGLLNPVLSFISIVLLIKSLTLQNQANTDLRGEIEANQRSEKLRSFETHFFNLINSQKVSFDSFKIQVKHKRNKSMLNGVEAITHIEQTLSDIIQSNSHCDKECYKKIESYLSFADKSDQIYNSTRIFYIIVKMVTERLSDAEGFTHDDRKAQLLTLINFTDFALLKLVKISIQFNDYHSVTYLKGSIELSEVFEQVGLGDDFY
ncbi:hypothetical protein AB6D75_18595 [Vibrio splendidus]